MINYNALSTMLYILSDGLKTFLLLNKAVLKNLDIFLFIVNLFIKIFYIFIFNILYKIYKLQIIYKLYQEFVNI
jgi:hypothetical protein